MINSYPSVDFIIEYGVVISGMMAIVASASNRETHTYPPINSLIYVDPTTLVQQLVFLYVILFLFLFVFESASLSVSAF